MEALVCELCGGKLTMKSGGIAVCEYCGMEYSSERMKERILEIKGTVRVDNTHMISNFIEMATTSLDAKNYDEAEKYLNRAIEIDPNDYWAWFLKGMAAGYSSSFRRIRLEETTICLKKALNLAPKDKIDQLKNVATAEFEPMFSSVLYAYCNRFINNPQKELASDLLCTIQIVQKCAQVLQDECGISTSGWSNWMVPALYNTVCSAWEKIYSDYREYSHPYRDSWKRFVEKGSSCVSILDVTLSLPCSAQKLKLKLYNRLIEISEQLINSCAYSVEGGRYVCDLQLNTNEKRSYQAKIKQCKSEIRQIEITQNGCAFLGEKRITSEQFIKLQKLIDEGNDSLAVTFIQEICKCDSGPARYIVHNFDTLDFCKPQSYIRTTPESTSSGGCYIATAVYGSYDCPQVWTLRRYRDNILAETWYGRAFIHIYYTLSPSAVKYFGNFRTIRIIWKFMLDQLVERLNTNGIEDSPYRDKIW